MLATEKVELSGLGIGARAIQKKQELRIEKNAGGAGQQTQGM